MPNPRLTERRIAAGLSGHKLAKLAGISQPQLWLLEHETKAPKGLKAALAIAAVLKCKVLDLWPDAAPVVGRTRPQRAPTPRAAGGAVPVGGVRRRSLKSGGKRKR